MKELDNSFFSLIDKNEIYIEIEQLIERRLKTANKNIEKYLYRCPLIIVIICFYSTLSFSMNKKFPNLLTLALFILFITLISLQSKKITKLICKKDHKYYTLYAAIFLNLVIAFYSQLFLFLIRYMDLLNLLYYYYLEVSLILFVNYFNHHSLKITLIKVFLNLFAQLVFTVSLNRDSLTLFSIILNSFSLLIFSQVLETMLINQLEMQIILKKERNHFLHIIDKTECGYVCLSSNKILIANQNFKRILHNCIQTESLSKTDILEFIFQNFQNVNKFLPKNIYDLLNRFNSTPVQEKNNEYLINDSDYDSEEVYESNNIENNNSISFEKIMKELLKSNEFSNFFSIGIIQFKINKELQQEIMFYEVFLRVSKYNYEILLKNYNKNKEVEQANIVLKNNSIYLAKVAHELKNPLITITSILESDFKSSFSQEQLNFNSDFEIGTPKLSNTKSNGIQKNNKFIMTLCNYLMYLIEDLNYFSKNILVNNYYHKQTTEDIIYQPFNLLNACEFCINIFKIRQKNDQMKSNIKIILEYDRNIPKFLYIPETKFKQILINLFSNAYKFTIHGHIKLALKNINNIINEEKSIRLLRIIVEDTGLGISKDNQEYIFECFHKIDKHQKYNQYGSGLGLTIVRELVSSINSKIQFESEENKGSKFWFDIEVNEKLDENETLLENGTIGIEN
jgi:signal transduction histidine kinase